MTREKIFWLILGIAITCFVAVFLILNKPAKIETTFYLSPSPSPKESKISFLIGGDMMFDRYVAYKFRNDLKASVANLGENFFGNVDVSLVNLEGPISRTEIVQDTNPENLVFNFPPQTVDVLKWLGLKSVGLANNHTLNVGSSGLENTKEVLQNAGITPIGSPNTIDETSVKRFSKGDQSISIIAVNAMDSQPDLADIVTAEKAAKSFVIVFPHWGSEYASTHSSTQEKIAHQWIDAGADLVVGAHPHVIQDAAIYNSKVIVYSLGNLLFDQSFSKATQQGLVLKGKITDKKLTLEFVPIQIKNFQPQLMEGEEKFRIIQELKKELSVETCQDCVGWDTFELEIT